MKLVSLLLLSILLSFLSCQKNDLIMNEPDKVDKSILSSYNGNNSYTNNEMIIQYNPTFTEAQKQLKRNQYNVINHKTCSCDDLSTELWTFNNGGPSFSIEDKVAGARTDSELEGVDFNLFIQQNEVSQTTSFSNIDNAISKRVASNNNVTIAILDTGVDYNYWGFANSFLYNSSINDDNCVENNLEDFFGWDFVNEDNDPFDDNGHGTIISTIIYEGLNTNNIDFQLLPIKVFNENGNGKLFDILCGFKYAISNPDVNIINMSFGWYDYHSEILAVISTTMIEDVLVICSAGNETTDTDILNHFPSNINHDHILSITALAENSINLAEFSNYGISSVDIAAKGENIAFAINTNNNVYVSGTSYACAYGSVLGGVTYNDNLTTKQHRFMFLSNTITNSNLFLIKYSSYIPE